MTDSIASDNPEELKAEEMPLMHHLAELRKRLLYTIVGFFIAFGFSFHFSKEIYDFLAQPLAKIMAARGHENPRFIFTGLTEAFFTEIKLAVWLSIFITFPLLASQVWMFIAPGLYKNEKRAFLPFLIATPILFLAGAAMAYYLVFPMAWEFFLGFESLGTDTSMPVQLEAKVNEYLSLVMGLILAFGFCFELPLVLVLMNKVGLVEAQTLTKGRRYAFVGILIVAAIVTPPDVISQLLLAVPLYCLYEIAVLVCHWQQRHREKSS